MISIDNREHPNLLEVAQARGFNIAQLPIADFVSEEIGVAIEHKRANDLLNSIDRIQDQLLQMRENYEKCYLLVSGYPYDLIENGESKLHINSLTGLLTSIAVRYQMPIINVPEKDEHIIYAVEKICQKSEDGKTYNHEIVRIRRDPRSRQIGMVMNIPGLGREKASKLLEKFGSVKSILMASHTELMEVEGIGNVLARHIIETDETK